VDDVIADSTPWKEDLLRVADALEKRKDQVRWTERTGFLVERDTMTAAYAVRKLVEAHRVSDELRRESVHVRRHTLVGKPVDIWNRHEFYEHYDMERSQDVKLALRELCNQIIHSWVWMLSADAETALFDGIYVSSDRESKKHVYFVPVDTLVTVFRAVGLDEIVTFRIEPDDDGVRHITMASRVYPSEAPDDLPADAGDS
jgi:hypothetical protein